MYNNGRGEGCFMGDDNQHRQQNIDDTNEQIGEKVVFLSEEQHRKEVHQQDTTDVFERIKQVIFFGKAIGTNPFIKIVIN